MSRPAYQDFRATPAEVRSGQSEEQLADYRQLFDNHWRLKELVHDLETLSLDIVEGDARWPG